MSKKALSKNIFLISFLPAIAYWYLEENYPIHIAVTGGMILATLEILFEKFYLKHIHTLSKFNFFLIAFLGTLSLLGDEGLWFKLQPAFTGVGIGAFLFYRLKVGNGLMLEMMESMNQKQTPPKELIQGMEKHLSLLFSIYGLFMAYVAVSLSTDTWLFFKTIGFYICFAIFMIFEFIWMRQKAKALHKQKMMRQVMSQMKPDF
jgi:intracellular septation protein